MSISTTTQLLLLHHHHHHHTVLIPSSSLRPPCWRRCNYYYNTIETTTERRRGGGWVVNGSRLRIVKCMANPRRVKMVAKQIRRELSDMLITDNVLQFAVLPEASLGADSYLSSVTTITDVEITTDLQVVKVYVSVFGDERGKEVAMAGLKSKVKYVRSELGRRMKLRVTPEIRFLEDESFERGSRVIAILDNIKNEKSETSQNIEQLDSSANEDESEQLNSSADEDDADWDDEDRDEGIIYVE